MDKYVALSRVTTLSGLHLVNYDHLSMKTNESAIIEYIKIAFTVQARFF